jgi:hypothetical protein
LNITFAAPKLNNVLNLVLAGVFVGLIVIAWRTLRASYKLLTATLAIVSFSYYTGPAMPYMGLPRHLLLAFPVFIGVTPFFEQGKRRFIAAGIFLPCMLMVVFMHVLEAWVP